MDGRGRVGGAVVTVLVVAASASCAGSTEPTHTVTLGYDFTISQQGWETGFADYPVGSEEGLELVAERRDLPASLDTTGEALYLAGLNTSDDLFMYLKRQINQLRAGREYRATYRIEIATDAPTGCVGVGGAPGESVFMKAGAAPFEPFASADGEDPPFLRMNIDKGQQSQGGAHAVVLGDLANGSTDCGAPVYRRKVFEGPAGSYTASPEGVLWLVVGTDSGFEGRTGIYVLSMEVELES